MQSAHCNIESQNRCLSVSSLRGGVEWEFEVWESGRAESRRADRLLLSQQIGERLDITNLSNIGVGD